MERSRPTLKHLNDRSASILWSRLDVLSFTPLRGCVRLRRGTHIFFSFAEVLIAYHGDTNDFTTHRLRNLRRNTAFELKVFSEICDDALPTEWEGGAVRRQAHE